VKTLKEAGAKEVHVLVSCPPHMHPCVYGIDFPDRSKLMAANNTIEEIRKYLHADSLHYLSQAGMVKATGLSKESFCMACYDVAIRCRLTRRWTSTQLNGATAGAWFVRSIGQGTGANSVAVSAATRRGFSRLRPIQITSGARFDHSPRLAPDAESCNTGRSVTNDSGN